MHKTLTRTLAAVAAVPAVAATLVAGATTAHAAPVCPEASDVIDFSVFTAGDFRIAVNQVSTNERHVCIQLATTLEAVAVIKSRASVTPPSITMTDGAGACATTLISMDDPADLVLSVGANPAAPSVCIGKDGITTTVTFNEPVVNALPDVDLYLPANSFLVRYGYCAAQHAAVIATPSATTRAAWEACAATERKVI